MFRPKKKLKLNSIITPLNAIKYFMPPTKMALMLLVLVLVVVAVIKRLNIVKIATVL